MEDKLQVLSAITALTNLQTFTSIGAPDVRSNSTHWEAQGAARGAMDQLSV